MNPQWHIAFCNVTITESVGMRYADYYGIPANMLEAQLAAADIAERRFGVGRFIRPYVDSPAITFASFLGMPVTEPENDELPYTDVARPLVSTPEDLDRLRIGDPKSTGLMAKRWEAWKYYRQQGYEVGFGGCGGSVVTAACEISSNNILFWLAEFPMAARRLLDFIVEANAALVAFNEALSGKKSAGAYTGDDFSGLMSPQMYREFAVPCYRRIYHGKALRSMHSELLHAEHLRIARDELQITSFHGAGCENLSLAEMHRIMGHDFWTQLTPREMLQYSPEQIEERIKEFANSGCGFVQLYPGRNTPERNMEAAIAAVQRECKGGATC